MPNPSGKNRFTPSPAYGDVKKLQNLEKAAPLAGAPTTSIGAPKRAQRRAVRGRGQGAAAPMQQAGAPIAPQVNYNAQLREVWNELLRIQPDNPLFQYYASKTQ